MLESKKVTKKIKVKICGLKTVEDAKIAEDNGADFLGFIFVKKSPRYIRCEQAADIAKSLAGIAKKVAVTIDPTDSEINDIMLSLSPDYIQLHGSETVDRVEDIKSKFQIKIIKVFKLGTLEDLKVLNDYQNIVEYFLFDSPPPSNISGQEDSGGGYGQKFNWSLLKEIDQDYPAIKGRWFLAGGINQDDLDEVAMIKPPMIDLSSGVEKSLGVKDPELIRKFLKKSVDLL